MVTSDDNELYTVDGDDLPIHHHIVPFGNVDLNDRGELTQIYMCHCGYFYKAVGRNQKELWDSMHGMFDEHTAKIAGVVGGIERTGKPDRFPDPMDHYHKYTITSHPIRSSKVSGNWNRI